MNGVVRLLVEEEQEILRDAYKAFFPMEPSIELVGIMRAEDGDSLIDTIEESGAEVVLIGTKILHADCVSKLRLIRESHPEVGLIVLSAHYDAEGITRFREFARETPRRCACLLKQSIDTIGQLSQTIQAVGEGRVVLDPAVMEGLIAGAKDTVLKQLTSRELEILNWMAKGYKNNTIAEVLCLDLKTVEHHINSIYSKLCDRASTRHPRVYVILLYMRATGQLGGDAFPED